MSPIIAPVSGQSISFLVEANVALIDKSVQPSLLGADVILKAIFPEDYPCLELATCNTLTGDPGNVCFSHAEDLPNSVSSIC